MEAELRPLLVGLGVGLRMAGPRVALPRVLVLPAPARVTEPTLPGLGVMPRGGGRELRNDGS